MSCGRVFDTVACSIRDVDACSILLPRVRYSAGAKHFYEFFCPPEGTFEHYQHFRVRVRNGGSGETGDDYRPLILWSIGAEDLVFVWWFVLWFVPALVMRFRTQRAQLICGGWKVPLHEGCVWEGDGPCCVWKTTDFRENSAANRRRAQSQWWRAHGWPSPYFSSGQCLQSGGIMKDLRGESIEIFLCRFQNFLGVLQIRELFMGIFMSKFLQ